MALTDDGTNTTMLVQPSGFGGNGGFGFGNDGGWWLIILFILLGGWNNNGFGGGFDGGLYPWMNNSQNINNGFRDQMINSSINSIQSAVTSGFGDVQTALCGGFAGVNAAVSGAQNAITAQMYGNQISDMQQAFANQTAMNQGFNGIQAQLAQCCCDNRAATADLKYTVATEACADRSAISDALRDVISANTASTQRILDQLCADKLEQKNDIIAQLRSELMYARGQASQDVQTAAIQAGQRALANEVEQYVLPTPRPAYVVQNPNCCQPYTGCGCGA